MPVHFRKTIAIAVVAGVLGSGLAPAMAADWDDADYGWGQHGRGDGHWRQGGWNRGDWDDDGPAAAAAAVGGFALGAAAGAAYQPRYGGCYAVTRPIYDYWGNVVDYRRVEVCE
ncbi:MAG: hypothetical protein ACR652_26475 [Methylocystis sp.]|uniref:hypothetical protein n=1 Tax=Methylocystis sp. TaxID=1911079 RepID=UPI003DA5D003